MFLCPELFYGGFVVKYIEKAVLLYPDMGIEEILQSCPVSLGLMKNHCETFADYCDECWNREVLDNEKL